MAKYYLTISDGFDSDDYEMLGVESKYDDSSVVKQSEYLVYFANLNEDEKKSLLQCFEISNSQFTLREYVDNVHEKLSQKCGRYIADILTLNIENRMIETNDSKETEIPQINLSAAKKYLCEDLEEVGRFASLYCMTLSAIGQKDVSFYLTATRISNIIGLLPNEIHYRPIVAVSESTGKLVCSNGYAVSSVTDALHLFFILAIKQDTIVTECKNCGKYFIPVSKRDEIYCQNCRKISYDTKIKDDTVRKTYRTIYKTQNARKQRNSHIRNIEQRFDNWKQFAKTKLSACIKGEITLEEMEDMISSDDWLRPM